MDDLSNYSIPAESRRILLDKILNHQSHKDLPTEVTELAQLVTYEGTDLPSLSINWKFAESIAALKGLEAILTNVLLMRKYNVVPQKVIINTSVYPEINQPEGRIV